MQQPALCLNQLLPGFNTNSFQVGVDCKMSKNKKVLFEESENEEEEEDGELHINKAYANKYQEWRLSEELQKCMY